MISNIIGRNTSMQFLKRKVSKVNALALSPNVLKTTTFRSPENSDDGEKEEDKDELNDVIYGRNLVDIDKIRQSAEEKIKEIKKV